MSDDEKPPRGRPKNPEATVQITTRVTVSDFDALTKMASAGDQTVGHLIREMIKKARQS